MRSELESAKLDTLHYCRNSRQGTIKLRVLLTREDGLQIPICGGLMNYLVELDKTKHIFRGM